MFKLISKLLVVLTTLWCESTSAALMPPVQVDGKEWLQPEDFLSHSWSEMASVCDAGTGVCNGSLGGNDLTGWVWASITDVNSLFNSFGIPGFTGTGESQWIDSSANSTWAPSFLATFVSLNGWNVIGGFMRNPYLADQVVYGQVGNDLSVPPNALGYVTVDGAVTRISPEIEVNEPNQFIGGWFYRENTAEVQIPATFPLLGLGLAALSYSRRKRNLLN